MAAVTVVVPLDKILLCDSRTAEVGDFVDLYLDPVKYPAPPVNPIRGAITDVDDPIAGDPVGAVKIIDVEIDDGDLPPAMATLESCDLEKVRCADCCVRSGERLDILEAKVVYYLNDTTTVGLPTIAPATQDEDLDDTNVNLIQTLDSGLFYWDPQETTWKELTQLYEWDPVGDVAPPASQTWIGKYVKIVTTSATFGGILWWIGDIAYTGDGINWERVGNTGQYLNEGVHLAGTQTITGNKIFTGTLSSTGTLANVSPTVVTMNPTTGSVSGTWTDITSWDRTAGTHEFSTGATLNLKAGSNFNVACPITHSGTTAGFLNATPAAQLAHVTDATTVHLVSGSGDDAEINNSLDALAAKINEILVTAETFGFRALS